MSFFTILKVPLYFMQNSLYFYKCRLYKGNSRGMFCSIKSDILNIVTCQMSQDRCLVPYMTHSCISKCSYLILHEFHNWLENLWTDVETCHLDHCSQFPDICKWRIVCEQTSPKCHLNAQMGTCQANMVVTPAVKSFQNVPQANSNDIMHYPLAISYYGIHGVHE